MRRMAPDCWEAHPLKRGRSDCAPRGAAGIRSWRMAVVLRSDPRVAAEAERKREWPQWPSRWPVTGTLVAPEDDVGEG